MKNHIEILIPELIFGIELWWNGKILGRCKNRGQLRFLSFDGARFLSQFNQNGATSAAVDFYEKMGFFFAFFISMG